MICHAFNKLFTKKKSYCFIAILICHAIWVTSSTDIKIIGKGYRRNLFSLQI
jgi:hypothetical protein